VHIKGGMNIVIEGGTQVSIKAGGSSIVLGPDGVSITGTMVKINSGGSPGSGNGASPVAPTAPEAPEAPEVPEDPLQAKHR
jgi:type VI secretion system secreted protein VgrG